LSPLTILPFTVFTERTEMPSSLTHKQQAQHNEEFIASFDLDATPYLDWVVTAIFYAALHFVDSYLATKTLTSLLLSIGGEGS